MNFVVLFVLSLLIGIDDDVPSKIDTSLKDTMKKVQVLKDTVAKETLTTSKRKAWIWYKPYQKPDTAKKDTEKVTVASVSPDTSNKSQVRDTISRSFLLRVAGIPDSLPVNEYELPIEPNTPEPIRNLLLNPTVENAEKVIAWLLKIRERNIKVANAMEIALMKYGLDAPYMLQTDYYLIARARDYTDSLSREVSGRGLLVFYLGRNYMSDLMMAQVRKLANLGFHILIVSKEDISDMIPQDPNIGYTIMQDIADLDAIGIKYPPAVIFYYPERRSVYLIARKPLTFDEIMKRIVQVEAGLWVPVLVF